MFIFWPNFRLAVLIAVVLIKKKCIVMKEHSIFMGIRDREIEFFDHNKRWSSISRSLKTQKVIQDMTSNAVLIHAERQKAAIDDKISHFLNF